MAVVEPARTRVGPTHEVVNQAPPLEPYNVFEQDRVAGRGARARGRRLGGRPRPRGRRDRRRRGASSGAGRRTRTRRSCARTTATGTASTRSSTTPPTTSCWRSTVSHGLHSLPWTEPRPGAHVARAALFMVMGQAEGGHLCPISMTYSGVPALRATPELAQEWEPRLTSNSYDPRLVPADDKAGALCGMAMTEKQGGSDVRANTTVARPLNGGGPGRGVRDHRPQVVLLGADVRRLPRARADRRRPVVLPAAAHPARRHAQPLPPPAPEGQARQPLQRLQRGRVRRRLGAHARRGGPRRPDDHRDGQPHAARLRARLGDGHAAAASRRPPITPRTGRRSASR